MVAGRIKLHTMIEIPVAGEIMVDADDIRRAGALLKEAQFVLAYPGLLKSAPKRVPAIDAAA